MNSKTILFITILALVAGCTVFMLAKHTPYTLVVQMKSLEKSQQTIIATGQSGTLQSIPFEIWNDSGESAYYTVEFSQKKLQSITIPPLASPGRYEVERITLANEVVSYRWEGASECRRRLVADPVGHDSLCPPGAPLLNSLNDAITISAIPVTGSMKSLASRFLAAFAGGVLTLLAGLYLFRPVAAECPKIASYVERSGWLLLIGLYLWQGLMLWRYSVDLPFWEEWAFFEAGALQRGLTLDWLFCHFGTNQQVVVFTKLMAWLDFKLFSLDFARLKLMNYLVFGLFLVVTGKFARQVTANGCRLVPLFLLFLVSPLVYEVHSASFQSGEVFVLLFSTLMLCHAAPEKPGLKESLLFSTAAIGAMYSMHTGVAVAAILLVGRSVFILLRVLSKTAEKRTAVIDLSVTWLITVAGISSWLSGLSNPTEAAVRLMPTTARFWEQFLDLLSFGFGFEMTSPLPGLVILLFLLTPLVLLLADKSRRFQGSTWQIMLAIFILLAIAAMITFGRGATFTTLKLSRYTVYITPLILFGAVAWWLALQGRRVLAGVLAVFWGFCFAAFSNNWSYGIYRDLRQMDLLTLECVEAYNNGSGDGNCPDTHGVPIGGFFDNARKLDINFTRKFARPVQPK